MENSMKIATKQVNTIAISEDLFHEVVEGQIPNLVEKQKDNIADFFHQVMNYIKEHTKKTEWFYMENCDLLYHNGVVGLFPNPRHFKIGCCSLSKPYDPSTFHSEFDQYNGSLMTLNEFKRAFAGKFDQIAEYMPNNMLDGYYTIMDFHKAIQADGVRTKRWGGFSKTNSFHIPIYRLNGMDSESIPPAKTIYYWLDHELIPKDFPPELLTTYKHILSFYLDNENCFEFRGDQIIIRDDIILDTTENGTASFYDDKASENSFIYDANKRTTLLENLSDETLEKIELHLLKSDERRADFDQYDENILIDPNRGHWGLWQETGHIPPYMAKLKHPLIARNPAADVNYDGIIGIDFGTKSTVVVYQDNRDRIIPMRIGTSHFSKKANLKQYENPTVMELINVKRFLELYRKKEGRPDTRWEDLTISHSAQNSLMNSISYDYYTFFNELKQWAGNQKKQIRLKDKSGNDISLPPFASLTDDDFNPIEIYAYYIGLCINNMNNGIFMNYLLSFPVTFEHAICEKIIESFDKGFRKSLPDTILHNEEIMKHFRVIKGTSEPAAYAICALESYGFDLEGEETEVYYGIFDFGGGTTDFDFGHWHMPDESESRRYDYVLECYGSGGDQYLGGENLLQLMSYEVFHANQDKLLADRITFSLPPECQPFPGSESLITESQEAKLNTRQLMEKLRPFWEREGDYQAPYQSGKIKLPLFTRSGEQKLNYELDIDIRFLDRLLHKRIELGIANFFECLKTTFKGKLGRDIHCVHIFLAGNGSRSEILTSLFETYMITYTNELRHTIDETIGANFFKLHPALGMEDEIAQKKKMQPAETTSSIPSSSSKLSGIEAAKYSSIPNMPGNGASAIESLAKSVSDIGDIAHSVEDSDEHDDDIEQITKPNGKTGVAFGLLEGRPGGRIKVIMPLSQNLNEDKSDIRFRFYIGYKRKNKFQMISDPNLIYNKWIYLCDASTEDFAIYYTPRSEAATGNMSIFDVYKKNCRLNQSYEDAGIYYRAVAPDTIEYAVIRGEEFDSENFLEGIETVELDY